jgi:hypothetical protein
MMSAATLARALGKSKKEGGGWRCLCPAHADRVPSLSVIGKNGTLLVICRAGCSQDDVIAALKARGLWANGHDKQPRTETVYDYRDEFGDLRYQVVRRPVNGSSKKFLQRRPNGIGGWIWDMAGVDPLPYRLREMLETEPGSLVFVVEGEKDVESLAAIGLVATTNHGGAGKWPSRREFSSWFTSRDVVILPDNDDAGRSHAADVAQKLNDRPAHIRILELPGLPEKGDVSDWLAAGGTRERLLALAARAPAFDPPPPPADDPKEAGDWYSRCMAGKRGGTLSNLSNALLALREDPAWRGLLIRNHLLDAGLVTGKLPKQKGFHMKTEYPRPVTDEDITASQEWLQLAGLPQVSRDTVWQAVELVATENSFHPNKDYLEPLEWDGGDRLDDWLTDCFGVEKTEYAMAVGRMFLIGMVARIYQPGCQADYMLILEGPQGIRKSTACRALAGEWFSDNMPENVASKDAALHLRGKWLIEIAELHTFSKSETAALKAFTTRRQDIYRPPYGRKEVHRPRQNLFIGTTNRKVYLQDPTGGRRFWPVVTSEIDIGALVDQRDLLFPEALVRYRRGEAWWPDAQFEAEHITSEQEQRFESDAWEQPIAEHIAKNALARTTIFDLARSALDYEVQRIGSADQRRIMAILESLGWQRGKREAGTGKRWWVRENQTASP